MTVAIFLGGVIGALARAGLERALPAHPGAWPWGTLAANIAGCLLLGYFATRLQERLPPSLFRRPLLGTGVCGALTTFSTLQIEVIRLARHHNAPLAIAYLATTIACGFAAVWMATALTRRARLR